MERHTTLHEWHWEAISAMLTATELRHLLMTRDAESIECFSRVKSTVMLNMFEQLHRRYFSLSNATNAVSLFETLLATPAFIPKSTAHHLPTVDRFGYMAHQQFVETTLCSVEVMRLYWRKMWVGVTRQHRAIIEQKCQAMIATLPGKSYECANCHWCMPETAMWSHEKCNYCDLIEKKADLKWHRGHVYIFYQAAIQARKTDSSMDAVIAQLRSCLISCECGVENHDQNVCHLTLALDALKVNSHL